MEQKLDPAVAMARLADIGRSFVAQRIHARNRAARNRSILRAVEMSVCEHSPQTFRDIVERAYMERMPDVSESDILDWLNK